MDLRSPQRGDAKLVFEMAQSCQVVDSYPEYFYLTMFRDFSSTCRIAVLGEQTVACVIAYLVPSDRPKLVIWQLLADETDRPKGVAKKLLHSLVADHISSVASVEATIDPENDPARGLLESLAVEFDLTMTQEPLYERADFVQPHRPENLIVLSRRDTP